MSMTCFAIPNQTFDSPGCPIASWSLRKIGLSILIRRVLSSNESSFRISGCSSKLNKKLTFHLRTPLKAKPIYVVPGSNQPTRLHTYERTPSTQSGFSPSKRPRDGTPAHPSVPSPSFDVDELFSVCLAAGGGGIK